MKHLVTLFGTQSRRLCAIALAALIGFSFAACGGSSPSDDDPPPDFSISGKFKNGDHDSFFTAQKSSGGTGASYQRAMGRAVSPTEVPLQGELADGDITFRLKGFYDEESGAYTLQAASSTIKFSITGTESGGTTASIALRDNANEPFGTPIYVQVDTEISGADLAGGMTSTQPADVAEGLAEDGMWGVWYNEDAADAYKYIVNEWGISGMLKDGGEWVEAQTMGFSKVFKKGDGNIDVTGDVILEINPPASGPGYVHEEFLAYLASEGYTVFDGSVSPLPASPNVFGHYFFSHNFDGSDQSGALVKGNNTYLVDIYYDPDGQYGSPEDKPFVVIMIKQEGEETPLIGGSGDPSIYAATLEGAIADALAAIRTDDPTAKYNPEIPWTISTNGVNMALAMAEWQEQNPEPTPPMGSTDDEMDAWYEAHMDEVTAWNVRYNNVFSKKLLENFPDVDNLIVSDTPEFQELQRQYIAGLEEQVVEGTPEYKTAFYKWNIKLDADGKLILTAYSTDGTEETSFAESYTEADELDELMDTPLVTLRR